MKNQRINLVLTFITLYFGLGAFFPFNSLYLQNTLHYSGEQIGLFYSLAALIVAFSAPLLGVLADKLKSPKTVYLLGACATFIFLIPYSFLKPFYIITTLYILINGIRSSLVPLLDTIALDYAYRTKKSDYGVFRSIASLSFIISSLMTGFLLEKISDFTSLFLYIHMIMLLLTTYFVFFQKNTYEAVETTMSFKDDLINLVKNKQFLLIIIIMGLSYGVIQVAQVYIALSIIDLGGSQDIVGLSFLFLVIPEVIFFTIVLKMAKKISHIYLMLLGTLYLLIRWVVLLLTNSLPILLFVSSAHGIIMSFVIIVGFDLLRQIIKPNLMSSAMSLYTGLANIFFSIISFCAGIIMNNGNIKNTYFLYFVTTILTIIGIITYIIVYTRRREDGK